jgi:hypothetical protein
MANRIRDVHVVNHRLDPHETDLRIHVEVDELTCRTEIKGRLMGPHCVYLSTVEIAYPMREFQRVGQTFLSADPPGRQECLPHIELRIIIPEPNWWEPKTPFLYRGPLELWQDGEICDRREISHGINRLVLTSEGLRLNGRPVVLRGKTVHSSMTDAEAEALHNDGVCLVISQWDEGLADLADRYGVFVLVCSSDLPGRSFLKHPSAFGWTMPEEVLGFVAETLDGQRTRGGIFSLWQIEKMPAPDEHPGPKIVLARHLEDPLPTRPDVIGWIESAS